MLKASDIKIPINSDRDRTIKEKISRLIKASTEDILSLRILKESIDARDKDNIFFVYTVAFDTSLPDEKLLKKAKNKCISAYRPVEYKIPEAGSKGKNIKPVIIGAGPAGLFAALILSRAGLKPLVIERGKPIEERANDVETFFNNGKLNISSNVQFGEGGAGAFSDGKLNTLLNDKSGRSDFVLNTFVYHGASSEILYSNKPHIGTDVLFKVIPSVRQEIIAKGGEFSFGRKAEDLVISEEGHARTLKAVVLEDGERIYGDYFIFAIGHSARDTFKVLNERNVPMNAKEFAVGFRIEHPQSWLSFHQYGESYVKLPPAAYKLASSPGGERGVYSFCMCPGGYVVNASSEDGMTAVNGMSYAARDSENANSAIIVSVGEREFDTGIPLSGMEYQRKLERNAYSLGKGCIPQQLLKDFVSDQPSLSYGNFDSMHKGKAVLTNLRGILGEDINNAFLRGMRDFDRKINGFFMEDAILSGVESRTSSPVRILRDEGFMSSIKGLIPCGEGAGYAGGIMSAAMDGMKCAEAVLLECRE